MDEDIKNSESEINIPVNYPDFCLEPDKALLEWGVREASYLTGFIGALNTVGFSEETLSSIILDKINLEYQKEMLRMNLESQERIANIYSKTPFVISQNGEE